MNSVPVPAMLVSTKIFTQSNIKLQDGSVVKAIPINSGSIFLETTTKATEFVRKETLGDVAMINGPDAPDVKISTKGRRPKSLATDMKPGFDPGIGMFTDRPMCRACGKYFMSRQQLNQHMLVHTDVRKYKCTYCERTFKQPSHLHQHHRIHTGEKPYRCPIPGCLRAFPQQSNLNHHLRNHDKPAPPPENTCSLCMRAYASETVLRSHIAKIHMCDPDSLLGTRKKTQVKDSCRQQHEDDNADAISLSGQNLKPKLLSGTVGNISRDQNSVYSKSVLGNPASSIASTYSARKPDAAGCLQNLSFMQNRNSFATNWTSGDNASKSEISSKIKVVNDFKTAALEKETYRQTVPEKNGLLYSNTLNKQDGDLLHHFIATTSRRTIGETSGTVVENINRSGGKADITGIEARSSSDILESKVTPNVHYVGLMSDTKISAESSLSCTSRSRKRKAFQPQRIVQKLDLNEEQEYINF